MDEEEKKKVKDMLKEKGKSQPLEWMYKGQKPELEDYLLGKRVDKNIEEEEAPKDDGVGAIFDDRIKANIELDMKAKMREDPLFAIKHKEEEVKRKLLQNPVKMKRLQKKIEEEQKKKMKASIESHHGKKESSGEDELLHKYLSILNKKGKEKADRHENHSEKEMKNARHGSDSDDKNRKHSRNAKQRYDSDSDSSDHRPVNYKTDYKQHRDDVDYRRREHLDRSHDDRQNGKRKRDTEFNYENERRRDHSSENKSRHKKSKKHKHKHKYDSELMNSEIKDSKKYHNRHDSDSSDDDNRSSRKHHREMKEPKRGKVEGYQTIKSEKREGANSKKSNRQEQSDSSSDSDSDSDESVQLTKKPYGLIVKSDPTGSKSRRRSRSPHASRFNRPHERSRSPKRHRSRSKSPKRSQNYSTKLKRKSPEIKPSKPSRKLTAEEKKKKLERMMENAQWREEQRTKNVKQYEDEDRKEAESLLKHGEKGAHFLNPMMSSHADKSSVEDRIKRNKFNLQRTRADLDRDFLKK